MDRLDAMQVFVAVAELRSFARAAERLGRSPAGVTRAVALLEEHLGVRLLHRTTRQVRLTDAGARYIARVKRVLADLDDADGTLVDSERTLSGQISVTASMLFGRYHVTPIVLAFLARHPSVSIRAVFSDSVLDLVEQNIDVAVRIAELPSSELHAQRVGEIRRVVCAAPSYLRKHGTPRHPRELAQHQLVAFSGVGEPRPWSFVIDGKIEHVSARPRLIVNTGDLALDAVRAGHGLTKVLSYQVDDDVRARRLKVLLSTFETPPIPVHVVHTGGARPAARVRAFVQFAALSLRAALAAREKHAG